jgi:hypothetical protein
MSLSERLKSAPHPNRGLPCPLVAIRESLSVDDRGALDEQMGKRMGDPGRIATSILANALNDEGFNIHVKSVERHRNRACRCFTGTKQ